MGLVYFPSFTIKFHQMRVKLLYMDGMVHEIIHVGLCFLMTLTLINNHVHPNFQDIQAEDICISAYRACLHPQETTKSHKFATRISKVLKVPKEEDFVSLLGCKNWGKKNKVADLSPIDFRKQSATDGTQAGSKYYIGFHQGLAAWYDSGPNLQLLVPWVDLSTQGIMIIQGAPWGQECINSRKHGRTWGIIEKGLISCGGIGGVPLDFHEILR